MFQAEALRLTAANQLIRSIQLNQVIGNAEAETGTLTETEDTLLEEDDG